MLPPHFCFDPDLLKDLCRIVHECLLDYLRTTLDLPDGLLARSGLFYVLPDVSLKPLEELFRARVITFLAKDILRPSRPTVNAGGVGVRRRMSHDRRATGHPR